VIGGPKLAGDVVAACGKWRSRAQSNADAAAICSEGNFGLDPRVLSYQPQTGPVKASKSDKPFDTAISQGYTCSQPLT